MNSHNFVVNSCFSLASRCRAFENYVHFLISPSNYKLVEHTQHILKYWVLCFYTCNEICSFSQNIKEITYKNTFNCNRLFQLWRFLFFCMLFRKMLSFSINRLCYFIHFGFGAFLCKFCLCALTFRFCWQAIKICYNVMNVIYSNFN